MVYEKSFFFFLLRGFGTRGSSSMTPEFSLGEARMGHPADRELLA